MDSLQLLLQLEGFTGTFGLTPNVALTITLVERLIVSFSFASDITLAATSAK